jgi:hypothetical protein
MMFWWRSSPHRVISLTLLIFSVCSLHSVTAYQTKLDPTAIEEAYSLGLRNDKVTAEFVAPYLKQVTEEGIDGLHRADIEVLTPYLQILDRSSDSSKGYTLAQARKDYQQRGDVVLIRIILVLPANYPTSPPGTPATACDNTALEQPNFWNNFSFVVKQRGKVLSPRSAKNDPIYSAPTKETPARLDGATVSLEFKAGEVASEPLTVDILTPHCKTINAAFDLAALR